MPYTVYTLTNTDDTHIYIGCTKDYERRRYIHMYACKRGDHKNHHLQALYNQLGPDCFEFDAVEEHATKAEAVKAEQRWVDYYLAAPEWQLMNIATENVDAPIRSDQISAKISKALKGRPAPNRKSVYVKWADGTEAEFVSSTEAAKHIGSTQASVSKWCNGINEGWKNSRWGVVKIHWV